MKIFLHICCGPCGTYSIKSLKNQGYDITGYFYNPNIHPYEEFRERENSVKILESYEKIRIIYDSEYGLISFLRKTVFHEQDKCNICYYDRLKKTAEKARELGFESFSFSRKA